MTSRFNPGDIQKAMVSPRWSGLVRLGATADAIARWDPFLLRDNRVLVPVDLQAMYVPVGDTSLFVRMPCALTTLDGLPPAAMPEPFSDGQKREPGVYLHWAVPDALLRGTLQSVPGGSSNRLGMPTLPDRWVVLRIIAPKDSDTPAVKGWVVEADTAKAVPLEQWPTASAATTPAGRTLARDQLTGTVGGSVNWSGVYDAGVNRLAFFDSLADLSTAAPTGVVNDLAAYLVAGWWSDPKLDPLDLAETATTLSVRLSELGWFLVSDPQGGGDSVAQDRNIKQARRETLGLKSGTRYGVVADALAQPTVSESKVAAAAISAKSFAPQASRFVDKASAVIATEPAWPRSTLLHGVIYGVPVRGPVVVDQRPKGDQVDVALGHHGDDVAAALAASGMGVMSAPDRRAMERLLSAFTGQVLSELGTAEGVVNADEHEHNAGFRSLPGGQGPVERLRKGAETGPLNVGRAARSEQARLRASATAKVGASLKFVSNKRADLYKGTVADQRADLELFSGKPPVTEIKTEVREVRRPAPRYFVPLEPMVAIRGAKRSLRHNADGRFSPDGKLHCRWPSQIPTTAPGILDGANYISSLPSGSLPEEVLLLARSAVVQDPYLVPWLAAIESKRRQLDATATTKRLAAESALRFGPNAVYDGTTNAFQQTAFQASESPSVVAKAQVADQLRRFSLFAGVDVDPVGVTTWSQPWIPLWLEWEVEITASNRLNGWQLSQIDFDLTGTASLNPKQVFRGRSPLHTGSARTLAAGILEWLKVEEQRDRNNEGEVDNQTALALHRIADGIGFLDVLAGALDGLNYQLLGLPVDPLGMLARRDGESLRPPAPVGLPQLLVAGELRLLRARIVDAFGRTLNLPVDRVHVVARDEDPGAPPALVLRPRLLRPARWMFRLVDPVLADVESSPTEGSGPAEATVDQIDPTQMVNPVSGFLLPDHMDEALEVFDTAGQPLGQLMHEPFGGGVMWEIAPGRTGPADAGPGFALGQPQRLLGLMAAGMVAADAQAREGKPAGAEDESALSAFLRAVDTTLWTIDTFAQMGNEHIAGLVGRPVAVVRATLRLDIDDDLDELDLSDADKRAKREAAYRDLADRAFPVRLGELTRGDDGLLGFFVDDDYSQFHIVDKVVRDSAFDVRPGHGQFAQLGSTKQMPDIRPITHPYIVAEDELRVRPGQVLRLTLLMHPSSRVHLTSGTLPRKNLQLARDWIHPGLSVMAPSLRVGPVLIDSDKVRLPKVSSFPKDQIWTRRSNPSTWKDDPILAATQTALLPELPSEIQEGYIRISPNPGGQS